MYATKTTRAKDLNACHLGENHCSCNSRATVQFTT
jgi:hypothetical protein